MQRNWNIAVRNDKILNKPSNILEDDVEGRQGVAKRKGIKKKSIMIPCKSEHETTLRERAKSQFPQTSVD